MAIFVRNECEILLQKVQIYVSHLDIPDTGASLSSGIRFNSILLHDGTNQH